MSLTKSIYKDLELETIIDPYKLRNSTAFRMAVAKKVDACSGCYTSEIQDVVDWLLASKSTEFLSVEELVIEWERHNNP